MLGASVLNQPQNFLSPEENHGRRIAEIDLNPKEQECISLIKACRNMEEFKQVHCQILKLGLFVNSFCASNLVATCALSQWGSMDYACSVFRQIDDPGTFEFNTMIRGYTKDMNSEGAVCTYLEMLELGVRPDNFTYPPLLKACSVSSAVKEGMQAHGQILKLGIVEDVFVQNSLINMYGKCGMINHSCAVFQQMDYKTIASWSALIAVHANSGLWKECLKILSYMNSEGCWRPEVSILVSVISACTHLGVLDYGRSSHGYVLRNFNGSNVAVETSLIDMYMRCGRVDKGMSIFQEMERRNHKTYSVVISGLASHGRGGEALTVFDEMLKEGLEPDDIVYLGVLTACSHGGLIKEGNTIFDKMRFDHRIDPTVQHYGCMVDLMGRAGMIDEALELIENMPMEPNDIVWRSLLSSCRIHQRVELGRIAAENLFKLNTQNAGDYLMLCNMYARAQRWSEMASIRAEMARMGLGQVVGSSSVEVKREVHRFVSNDTWHPRSREIYEMLHQIEWQLRLEGYSPDTSHVLFDVDEEEKRERLKGHSQKLAIAFSLISQTDEERSPVRIVRNVRMCGDCHNYTKLVSVVYECEIVVRDRNVFHHFRDGSCSCKDYW